MKKINKAVLFSFMIGAPTLLATTSILAACKTTTSNQQTNSVVLSANETYLKNEQANLTAEYSYPVHNGESGKQQNSIIALHKNAEAALVTLENIDQTNLSVDEKIWLESFKTQWKIKKGNIENGLFYLGVDPITGPRMLSSSSNHISNAIKDAINIYDLNESTGDPDPSKPNKELIKNINSKIEAAIKYIKTIQNYLKDGMNLGIMPSNLIKKSFINQMLDFFYQSEIENGCKASNNTNPVNVKTLFQADGKISDNLEYLTNFKNTYDQQSSVTSKPDITESIKVFATTINDFMFFYVDEYWTNSNSYGYSDEYKENGNKVKDLTISTSNPTNGNKEVEKTIIIKQVSYFGTGFTQSELDLQNVGIGFMNPKNDAKNHLGTLYSGNSIYNQMLYNNNSITDNATTIRDKGLDLSNKGTEKMKEIAKQVITEIFGYQNTESEIAKWDPEIWYTSDPFNKAPEKKKISEHIKAIDSINTSPDYFEKFNVWLNQEDFFFGREKNNKDQLIKQYWTDLDQPNADPELKAFKDIIVNQGYEKGWKEDDEEDKLLDHINGSEHTVSAQQALAGGVLSLEEYTRFKDSTDYLFNLNFNKIDDYVLSPYNFDIRKEIGVGMEGPRGSKQFQYNSDPYYSLQKWSVATLTVHEGAMGHHTQQQYWTEYMPGTKNGQIVDTSKTPGYTFTNVAFHEGWAVFTEWLAAELGIYGTWNKNDYNGNTIPTNWTTTTSKILSIENAKKPTQDEHGFIRDFHGGTYLSIVKDIVDPNNNNNNNNKLHDTQAKRTIAATKLANMLSYYGFLNEAQLRNMRLALDTSVHFNKTNNGLTQSNLPYGASISQQRAYMKANSGLGAGDISSESVRYMSMPSQATGYMLGKIIINDLYSTLKQKYNDKNSNDETDNTYNFVVNEKQTLKDFFDLILRNGEIPLEVLQTMIKEQFALPELTVKP